jgi:hypothetical protein
MALPAASRGWLLILFIDVLNETNGCNNVEDIYFLSYINMFRASLCPSSGYRCGEVA